MHRQTSLTLAAAAEMIGRTRVANVSAGIAVVEACPTCRRHLRRLVRLAVIDHGRIFRHDWSLMIRCPLRSRIGARSGCTSQTAEDGGEE